MRTNVAVVNLESKAITVIVGVQDPATGERPVKHSTAVTIGPYGWTQVGSVLKVLGSPLTEARGYVSVPANLPPARFLAYGVTNDGAVPGGGTDDGAIIPGR